MSTNSVLFFQTSNRGSLGVGSPGFSYSLPSNWAFDQSQSASPGFGITASADIYGELTGTISATTGTFSISYPISVDAIFSSSVADGQTVTIDTSDYSVNGAASPTGPGIGANLDLSLGGSLSLSAPGWAGISTALNLDIPLSLSQEFDKRLIAVDGQSLGPADEQKEDARLTELLGDPEKQHRRKLAEDADQSRVLKVLRALPERVCLPGHGRRRGSGGKPWRQPVC